ncbi:hypothetical protein OYC64_016344 [Pagothenia borchgrevinki]|uniref:Uncharacterized protein n=1 Tax=Pagothenia borchgrevinki TaxID=8213 RepID=A0ABD2HIY3_PAGBO
MKMAGLCWISVLLAVSLSIGDCATMDLDYVTIIAKLIEDTYYYNGQQFSVAVNIPKVQKTTEELEKVILPVDWDVATPFLKAGKVYQGSNAVVAVPQERTTKFGNIYNEHAEKQVMNNLGDLANTHEGDILVLYSWMSPCGKCTEEGGDFHILDKIKELKNKGKSFALVFHTVHAWIMYNDGMKKDIPEADIKNTFRNLRKVIVDDNIFRCYYPNGGFRCVKCFQTVGASNQVTLVAACVKNEE